MRYAVMSDVHGNYEAFRNALADANRQGAERIVLLGDIVGYGYDPHGCVAMAMSSCDVVVLGNHDAATVGKISLDWFNPYAARQIGHHRKMLDGTDREYLRGLEYEHAEGGLCFAHGSIREPIEDFGYVETGYDAERECEAMEARGLRRLFVGHTHQACLWTDECECFIASNGAEDGKSVTYALDRCKPYVVNAGSVGFPRRQAASVYVIYDSGEDTVEFRTLEFDFDEYEKKMESAGMQLPNWFERVQAMASSNNERKNKK